MCINLQGLSDCDGLDTDCEDAVSAAAGDGVLSGVVELCFPVGD